jgi:hypothetical protein
MLAAARSREGDVASTANSNLCGPESSAFWSLVLIPFVYKSKSEPIRGQHTSHPVNADFPTIMQTANPRPNAAQLKTKNDFLQLLSKNFAEWIVFAE